MSKLHRGGRPPKKRTERLNILLTDTEYKNLQKAADVMGVYKTDIIREGIVRVIRHLKSQGKWDADKGEESANVDN